MIAFQIQRQTLKKVLQIEDAITTAFQHLDFVVEALNKAAVSPIYEEVLVKPAEQGFDETIKAFQSALAYCNLPLCH